MRITELPVLMEHINTSDNFRIGSNIYIIKKVIYKGSPRVVKLSITLSDISIKRLSKYIVMDVILSGYDRKKDTIRKFSADRLFLSGGIITLSEESAKIQYNNMKSLLQYTITFNNFSDQIYQKSMTRTAEDEYIQECMENEFSKKVGLD